MGELSEKLKPKIGRWADLQAFKDPLFDNLGMRIKELRSRMTIFPEREDVFKAFQLTPLESLKVVILGQDPYHDGNATGLAFECGVKLTPSWRKIVEGYKNDLKVVFEGDLEYGKGLDRWARQGVLLLNTSLTVEKGLPNSHKQLWRYFTERLIRDIIDGPPIVFIAWGKDAESHLTRAHVKHTVITAEHPAAASYAGRPWKHNNCFTEANKALRKYGYTEINW